MGSRWCAFDVERRWIRHVIGCARPASARRKLLSMRTCAAVSIRPCLLGHCSRRRSGQRSGQRPRRRLLVGGRLLRGRVGPGCRSRPIFPGDSRGVRALLTSRGKSPCDARPKICQSARATLVFQDAGSMAIRSVGPSVRQSCTGVFHVQVLLPRVPFERPRACPEKAAALLAPPPVALRR